jgi:uncharacterized protein YgbK (DUF1537 family)
VKPGPAATRGAAGPVARAIVADDLTGAMDSGVQVLAATPVTVEVSPAERATGAPVAATMLVINTQSRGGAATTAAARVRAACARLRGQGRAAWFKKLDSTLRGNVGGELAAMHAALAPCTIVCTPALPAQGRTVVAGELRVQGQPVMSTPYRDEIAPGAGPAGGSAVIDIVRRQWPACRAVRLAAPAGSRELAAALRAAVDLVVVDAASDAHLRHLAAVGREAAPAGSRLLWAGSAGLLRALAQGAAAPYPAGRSDAADGAGGRQELAATRPLLLVAGSRRTLAHAQLRSAAAAAPAHLSLCLEPPLRGSRTARWRMPAGGRWAVADRAAALTGAVQALAAARDLFLWAAPPGSAAASHSAAAATALADLAGDALEATAARPRTLLLVGGDTAYACLRRLGIGGVALGGEVEPYVPWGRVIEGPWAGTVVITKAGGFGDPHTLRRICRRLLTAAG